MPRFNEFNINYPHLGKVLEAKKEMNLLVRSNKAVYVSKCGNECPFFSMSNSANYYRCSLVDNGQQQEAEVEFLSGDVKFPSNCPISKGAVCVKVSQKSEKML